MPGHDIIVIGASAGGVEALTTLISALPADLPAAVFVVLHVSPHTPSLLPAILDRVSALKALHPQDGMPITPGYIYIAPPDRHLVLEDGYVRVTIGPKENRSRPSVDPLFRSAARVYGPRTIGVILTGALDDGTAGLLAIKRRGGIAVVQDPNDALYPSMPRSAVENVVVDYVLPLVAIAAMLVKLAQTAVDDAHVPPVPEDITKEAQMAEGDMTMAHDETQHIGQPSAYSCPECGGVLWEVHDGELLRFRCRVGHALSADTVVAEKSEALETALWAALNVLEESTSLCTRMAEQARSRGQEWLAVRFDERVHESNKRSDLIRRALSSTIPTVLPNGMNPASPIINN